MDDDIRVLIEQIEKRFDALRAADMEAVKLRHSDLTLRMEGFPQEFARKAEMVEASRALQKLERDSVSREIYDTNHKALAELVTKLGADKMDEAVFQTFVENYRLEQEAAATERRAVAAALASATSRQTYVQEGAAASWKQVAVVSALVVAILTVVVLVANIIFR